MTQRSIDLLDHQPSGAVRLYCLPHAGASAAIYRNWQQQVPSKLQICPVELPGRGWRFGEALSQSIPELAREIVSSMRNQSDIPFAFFGHSMGATIAYEVVRRMEAEGNKIPFHLIVSGARAPFLDRQKPAASDLSDSEFLSHIRELNGTSSEILAETELMAVLLPVLRADFAACERYIPEDVNVLQTPITALTGDEDIDVATSDVEAWSALTVGEFQMLRFASDHFFIRAEEAAVVKAISKTLLTTNTHFGECTSQAS